MAKVHDATINVAFAPTSAGQKTSLIDITANPGGALAAAVSGTVTN